MIMSEEIRVTFDLSPDGAYCDGTLLLTKQGVTVSGSAPDLFVPLENVDSAVQYTDIGCGRLELKARGHAENTEMNIFLCRFSMSKVFEIGEFVKVLNHVLETGVLEEIKAESLPICPKCHRRLLKNMDVCLFCVKKSYVFRRAFTYFKPYLKSVIAAGLILTLSSVINSALPLLNSNLIDNYLIPTAKAKPYFSSRAEGVAVLAVMMAVFFALSQILSIFSSRLSNRIGSHFSNDLRLLVYSRIQALSVASIASRPSGNLIKRVTRDTEKIKDFFNEQGRYLIVQTIMFIVVLIILFSTNVLLTVVVLVPIPIGIVAISYFWKATRGRYEKQWRIDSRATSILHDIIKGISVVKAFGSEEKEIEKFSGISKDLAYVSASNEKYWAVTFPLVGNFMAIGEFFVLLIGGKMVLDGTLTLGELTRFNLYLAYLYAPMRWMSTFPRRVADASTSLIKIYDILDEKQQLPEEAAPKEFDPDGDLVFQNVEFGYKSYEPVLKGIDLRVKSGEMIGLVGRSGAGKSTLISLCMRLYDPSYGSITLGGTDLREIASTSLRDCVGVVFQETYLFTGTIFDNIAYALPGASEEKVIAAAKMANAHDFIIKLPDGYQTVIGENGHTLSGGERQRLSIARAVLKNPHILILDEATSSLDPETEIKIQEALARLTKGRTTIAIAHRLSTLRNADRLIVIDRGRIAEAGSHAELMAYGGIYRDLVYAQRQTASLHRSDTEKEPAST